MFIWNFMILIKEDITMAFDWEQNAFLGYMVENYQRDRSNDLFGRPLNEDNDEDEDKDDNDPFSIFYV